MPTREGIKHSDAFNDKLGNENSECHPTKNTTQKRYQEGDIYNQKEEKSKGKKIMGLLEKLWDDVVAGPQPERGLGRLRKITTTQPLSIKDEGEGSKYQRSMSMPESPGTPATPVTPTTPVSARRENVWRSVFHPGSNLATKSIGAEVFDKPQPNSPTVYDWLYSGETRSKYHN